jgi:hypothetical protein
MTEDEFFASLGPSMPTRRKRAAPRRVNWKVIAALIGGALVVALTPPKPPPSAEDKRDAECSGVLLWLEEASGEHVGIFQMPREIRKLQLMGLC